MANQKENTLIDLVKMVSQLRSTSGCPWDQQQTHESLKRNLIEESYEVLDAIGEENPQRLPDELGDILLQILFHSQIASEKRQFTIQTVMDSLKDKLVRRHPHVFGTTKISNVEEAEYLWEHLKSQERINDNNQSSLGKIPNDLPALAYGQLMQERASINGFDWENREGALMKISEEIEEIANASTHEAKYHEFGDLLFTLVNVGRWIGINSEECLREANKKFQKRYIEMEKESQRQGTSFKSLTRNQKENLWEEIKQHEV